MKFRCVNKFLKTTISDPHFIQIHLKKSSQNPHVVQFWRPGGFWKDRETSFVTLSIPDLLQKKITFLHDSHLRDQFKDCLNEWKVVGSCNGLICFICYSSDQHNDWFCFWNPAMRTKSKRFSSFDTPFSSCLKYSFGYDNSAGTYKVVAFSVKNGCNKKSVVKVFSLGDNSWRKIQRFPVLPLYWSDRGMNDGVYLSGTINWLALGNYFWSDYESDWFKGVTVEQYVIVSLDLSTEVYTQMLLPRGFVEVPPRRVQPTIVVLTDCLCFGHDSKRSHFVIWQMKVFGVQLFKISYQTLDSSCCVLEFPLYLSENGHTFIFALSKGDLALVYNCIDNKIEEIRTTNKTNWWLWVTNYIESLVPTR